MEGYLKQWDIIPQLKKALSLIVIVMCIGFGMNSVSATTIYEGADAYASNIPHNDKLSTYVVGEESSDYAAEFNKYKTYIVVHDGVDETRAMNLKKGGLHVTFYGLYASTGDVIFYSDEACTEQVGKISLTTSSTKTESERNSYVKTGTIIIPSTGVYYAKFTNTTGNVGYYQFSTHQFDGRNRRLTTSKTMSFIDPINGPIYYLVDVKNDGYITLTPEFCNNANEPVNGDVELTLTDSDKKEISKPTVIKCTDEEFFGKAVYAVKAGTYYVKATAQGQRLFTLSCKQKAVNEVSGKNTKTSVAMKSGTWNKGIVTYEDKTSKADYYHFTLTKPSTVLFYLKGNVTSGKITGEIVGQNVNGAYTGIQLNTVGKKASKWQIRTKSSAKLPAGTYYVKMKKANKKTNGNYQIKVVTK